MPTFHIFEGLIKSFATLISENNKSIEDLTKKKNGLVESYKATKDEQGELGTRIDDFKQQVQLSTVATTQVATTQVATTQSIKDQIIKNNTEYDEILKKYQTQQTQDNIISENYSIIFDALINSKPPKNLDTVAKKIVNSVDQTTDTTTISDADKDSKSIAVAYLNILEKQETSIFADKTNNTAIDVELSTLFNGVKTVYGFDGNNSKFLCDKLIAKYHNDIKIQKYIQNKFSPTTPNIAATNTTSDDTLNQSQYSKIRDTLVYIGLQTELSKDMKEANVDLKDNDIDVLFKTHEIATSELLATIDSAEDKDYLGVINEYKANITALCLDSIKKETILSLSNLPDKEANSENIKNVVKHMQGVLDKNQAQDKINDKNQQIFDKLKDQIDNRIAAINKIIGSNDNNDFQQNKDINKIKEHLGYITYFTTQLNKHIKQTNDPDGAQNDPDGAQNKTDIEKYDTIDINFNNKNNSIISGMNTEISGLVAKIDNFNTCFTKRQKDREDNAIKAKIIEHNDIISKKHATILDLINRVELFRKDGFGKKPDEYKKLQKDIEAVINLGAEEFIAPKKQSIFSKILYSPQKPYGLTNLTKEQIKNEGVQNAILNGKKSVDNALSLLKDTYGNLRKSIENIETHKNNIQAIKKKSKQNASQNL